MSVLLAFLFTSGAGAAQSGKNLLVNADFERGREGWQPQAAPSAKIEILSRDKGSCARISATRNTKSTYLIQTFDAMPLRGKPVRLEALVKAENVVRGPHSWSQGKIILVTRNGKAEQYQELDFLGTRDWRKVAAVWTIPRDAVQATLYLGLHTCTGAMWFDDVKLFVPEVKEERPVADGVTKGALVDGCPFLRVQGRQFTEAVSARRVAPFEPRAEERRRGFAVFQPDDPSAIFPGFVPARAEIVDSFDLAAAPGQYEPLALGVFAFRPLDRVHVACGPFQGPGNASIPQSALDVRMGRYMIQRVGYTGSEYHVVPKLLVKHRETPITPQRPQLFWITLRVPDDAPPGNYVGAFQVHADGAVAQLPVRLRVLPFRLTRGKTWMMFYYNKHPDDADLFFRDMREHGMTSVILGAVSIQARRDGDKVVMDFTASDRFVEVYRRVGFSDPLVYSPFSGRLATRLLQLFGLEESYPKANDHGATVCEFKEGEYPEMLNRVYAQVIRDIHDHARKAGWPPLVFYMVDEPRETGWRMNAARLEYRLTKQAVPEARTLCTAYFLPIMKRLHPWLDVRACRIAEVAYNAADNRALEEYRQWAGGAHWGIEWPAMWDDFWPAREIAGFLPAKAGLPAMTAWTYYLPSTSWTDEYHDLRRETKACRIVYRDTDGSLIPTVTWEGIRAGAIDGQYIATLEKLLDKAAPDMRRRASNRLAEILAQVPWLADTSRRDPSEPHPNQAWGNRTASALRAQVADEILRLSR